MRSKPLTRYSPPPTSMTATSVSSCSSEISPTISSTMSSSVMIPAVPPYSSTTTAICRCSLCSSRSSSETYFVSETKNGGRPRSLTLFPSCLRTTSKRSFTWTTPVIRSMLSL